MEPIPIRSHPDPIRSRCDPIRSRSDTDPMWFRYDLISIRGAHEKFGAGPIRGFWSQSHSGINLAQEGVAHEAPIWTPDSQKVSDLFGKIGVFEKSERSTSTECSLLWNGCSLEPQLGPNLDPPSKTDFQKKWAFYVDRMLKKAAQKLLKAPQNLPHLGTPKIYQKYIFGNLGGPRAPPKWGPLGLYFMPQDGPSWGLRFWLPDRFFMIWGAPLGTDFGEGFRNQIATFLSILRRQNAHFFWKSVPEGGPSWGQVGAPKSSHSTKVSILSRQNAQFKKMQKNLIFFDPDPIQCRCDPIPVRSDTEPIRKKKNGKKIYKKNRRTTQSPYHKEIRQRGVQKPLFGSRKGWVKKTILLTPPRCLTLPKRIHICIL